jgi:hypothetical protein
MVQGLETGKAKNMEWTEGSGNKASIVLYATSSGSNDVINVENRVQVTMSTAVFIRRPITRHVVTCDSSSRLGGFAW